MSFKRNKSGAKIPLLHGYLNILRSTEREHLYMALSIYVKRDGMCWKGSFFINSSTCKSHNIPCVKISVLLILKYICRFLWIILVIGMIILSVLIIAPIYEKYRTSPTVTTVSETNYPVWDINFPAVTICSNNKIIETQLNKILKDSKGA